jgi:hypothetical protein
MNPQTHTRICAHTTPFVLTLYPHIHTYTGLAKSRFTVQKIEYLHYGSYERAEFFIADRRVVIVHFLRDKTEKNHLKL